MRSTEAMMEEILRRRGSYRRKKEIIQLTCIEAGLCILLAAALVNFPRISVTEETSVVSAAYGAFVLTPKTGGYIIVALLAFVIGVIFTVIITKKNRQKKQEGTS